MSFIQCVTYAGDSIILEQYHAPRYNIKGIDRSVNEAQTSEAQERANIRKTIRELTIKLNANFEGGDYHLALDYKPDDRPDTIEEAKADRLFFMRRLRYAYKKAGIEMKYVIVTEFGKKGALHHHLILNKGLDTDVIHKAWKKGRVHFNLLDNTGEYSELAAYILKNRAEWKKRGGHGRQWTGSRNLKRPPTIKRIIRMDAYYEKPKTRPGYYIKPGSEFEGFTKDGYPIRSYILVKTRGNDP